jgi:TatD DNase family protein
MMNRKKVESLSLLPRLTGPSVIDSHCHLDMNDYDADRAEVIGRAEAAGVASMITIGAGGSMESNEAAVTLASRHPHVFATVGIHPHDASTLSEDALQRIRDLARGEKVVAIGETGLDYHYDNSPREAQRQAFRVFIESARNLKLPLVVHLREADSDAVRILREEHAAEVGGVIHCFSGDAASARQYLDLGFHVSFSGIVTFRNAEAVREAARIVPADRLLVETDAPYLAPHPYRGLRNEPALVLQTACVLAEIRGEPLERVAERTTENTRRLFRLADSQMTDWKIHG